MKKIERVLLAILIGGYILRITQLPFGGIIFTFASLFLAVVYLILSFSIFPERVIVNKDHDITVVKKGLWASIISGIFLSHELLGVLFLVQNWPFHNTFMFFVYLLIIQTVVIFVFYIVKKEVVYKRILLRCLLFTAMFFIKRLIEP